MNVEFRDRRIERIVQERRGDGSYPIEVVRALLKCAQALQESPSTASFRSTFKSMRLEKLKGDRKHQHSLRLNAKWRLIVELQEGTPETATVIEITDYH
ncbi:MAG: type II toxin-antitoxin system RelE/ParE family toxin [Planctomycetes bacterium]|nr:type II toxin-antitoxin system RelE/ParE family toxin [Planctomycetota bacterium]MCB9903641.1 type II toxin-antitoxin system RelE/ParE family toxin [Planctomycetota bacterium]